MLRLCPAHGRSASLGVNEEWAGPDSGLPRDDWRIWRSVKLHLLLTDSGLYYKKSLKLFRAESHRGFLECIRKTNCCNISWYLFGEIASRFASYISHNYRLHHNPCFSFTTLHYFFLVSSFIHSFIYCIRLGLRRTRVKLRTMADC